MTRPASDHFNGKTFFNPIQVDRGFRDILRWRRTSRPAKWPAHVEVHAQPLPSRPQDDAFAVTWIGHATFLIQTRHGTFLTDPQFSRRCGPFGVFGPKRVHEPGVALEALPPIDVVLLSHNHYDHCDLASLRTLSARGDSLAVTPLENGSLLRRAGFRRIQELDWWETHTLSPELSVTVVPSRHWSNRLSTPRNTHLWGGFVVTCGGRRFWFAGDTGYDEGLFRTIRDRCGAPSVAFVPIGAYEPRWFMAPMHCNPAEAVEIHRAVGAETSLAMHWGAWQLTDEAREAPVEALEVARRAAGISPSAFRVLQPGESASL